MRGSRRFWLGLVLLEGIVALAVVIGASWADRNSRSRGPEGPVIAYAAAVGRADLAHALDQLVPEVRSDASGFVEHQLGNRYTILESVVRDGALLDRLAGSASDRATVVVTLDIQEETARWRTTEEVPVRLVGDRWHLLKPPLQPPDDRDGG